ncbi:uncharacterized protein LOC126992533 [Eriocheir sinensis]|uniref:uncharacterized protein LOC126992533 n=1 Tax=Eriocheir sinensis TaxID=95602 RepID=UPI0021C5704F|nr:uncharacterized protein LOC126992533 [Eriocheir sinensis]
MVTWAALEGMLTGFTLALTGLLQLTPDEATLRVIAKATVEECFHTVASPAASPATPLQTPTAEPPTAQTRASDDSPPPVGEARMEVDTPSRSSQPAVAPAVSVAQPAQATQTAKPRSHIPVRAAPTRSRIPQPNRMVTPKRRRPSPSRAAAPVTTPGASSATGR